MTNLEKKKLFRFLKENECIVPFFERTKKNYININTYFNKANAMNAITCAFCWDMELDWPFINRLYREYIDCF